MRGVHCNVESEYQLSIYSVIEKKPTELSIQPVPQIKRHLTIIKINLLILFEEIIAVYTENSTRP
jgi:hypothetical protein